ncbi:MAG: hypothetical protein RLZZ09_3428, partial [Pseudomonadota bacterium]
MSDYTQREDDYEEELDGTGGIEILPIVNLLLRNLGSIL